MIIAFAGPFDFHNFRAEIADVVRAGESGGTGSEFRAPVMLRRCNHRNGKALVPAKAAAAGWIDFDVAIAVGLNRANELRKLQEHRLCQFMAEYRLIGRPGFFPRCNVARIETGQPAAKTYADQTFGNPAGERHDFGG